MSPLSRFGRLAVVVLHCLVCGLVAAAPLEAPPLPPEAGVQPIALGAEGSESIALGSVVFRIATGTAIGNL